MQMDLSPFFANVERMATALERIALALAPTTITHQAPSIDPFDRIVLLKAMELDPVALLDPAETNRRLQEVQACAISKATKPAEAKAPTEAAEPEVVFTPLDTVIKEIFDGGTTSANGIANKLNDMGRITEKGRRFNNVNVKPLMNRLGLQSPYDTKPKVESKPEAPAEPAPEPDQPRKPIIPGANPFEARNNLRAVKTASDAELIAEAIAAGRVTKLPACVDSDGFDHLAGRNFNLPKGGYIGSAVRKAF
jgi:hypothetical protein